eukprot:GHVH01005340.1.p1 GENE.GHVH01005340.1~~GHVH01005340.1.p1  ORF type:complete len:271 (+),score=28.91 GHVH01005340.1:89-814(+)
MVVNFKKPVPGETFKHSANPSRAGAGDTNQRLATMNKEIVQKEFIADSVATATETLQSAMTKKETEISKFTKVDNFDDGDDELNKIRSRRLQEMQAKSKAYKSKAPTSVREMREDEIASFLEDLKPGQVGLLHFYLPSFIQCDKMAACLNVIAQRHGDLRLGCINAESCPFWAASLAVKILPTLVVFKDGLVTTRFSGFDSLGGDSANAYTVARAFRSSKLIPYVFDRADYGVETIESDSE